MKNFKIRTLIFAFLALTFLIISTIAAPPEKQKTLSSAPAAMTSIIPGRAATYYGSQIRIYFRNYTGKYLTDLDIYFWGWYPPWYYPFPWWYCTYYNYYPYTPFFPRINYLYNPSSPSIYRWWGGNFPPNYPIYFGWWIYWPRFPIAFIRWTLNNVPYGPYIPIFAYDFIYIGPWLRSDSSGGQTSTASSAVDLILSNDPNNMAQTIESIQIGYSNKMYQLQDLTWDKLSTDSNITWGPTEYNIQLAPGASITYPNMPASDVGMIYRATVHLNSDPSQVVEYIVQYTTGAWSTEFPYRATDIVTYGDNYYKCLQNHTSALGLEPPNASNYWTIVPAPTPPILPSPPPTATEIPVIPASPPTPTPTPTISNVTPTPTPTATPTASAG